MSEETKTVKETVEEAVGKFKDSLKDYAKAADMTAALEDFKKTMTEEMDTKELSLKVEELKGVIERQAVVLESQKNGLSPEKAFEKSLELFIKEKGELTKSSRQELKVKTSVLTSSVSGNTTAYRDDDPNNQPLRLRPLRQLFTNINIGEGMNGTYKYTDQIIADTTRAAKAIAEGDDFPVSDIKWIEKSLSLKKIGDTVPFSYEAMRDVKWMEQELRRFIDVNIDLEIDDAILNADGTGDEPTGINEYASAFTDVIAANYPVEKPTVWDVMRAMKTQIEKGKKGANGKKAGYNADVVIISPEDFFTATSGKDTLGQPLRPAFVNADFTNCAGMKIVEHSEQTAGTLTVLCSREGAVIHEGVKSLELGYGTGGFESDIYTLKGRERVNFLIKDIDKLSVYKTTDIDATIAAMDSAV